MWNVKEAEMKLAIVGTGDMGKVLRQYAEEEGTFDTIFFIEPTDENTWPSEKPDLLIDFSHPEAINSIYDFARKQGGGFGVVLATTGYSPQEWEIIKLIQKICPLVQLLKNLALLKEKNNASWEKISINYLLKN